MFLNNRDVDQNDAGYKLILERLAGAKVYIDQELCGFVGKGLRAGWLEVKCDKELTGKSVKVESAES